MQHDNNNIAQTTAVPQRSWWQRLLAFVLILILLVIGVSLSKYLIKTKPHAQRQKPPKEATLVQVQHFKPIATKARIRAFGSVKAAQQIQLAAQVSGQIIKLHPHLIPGGFVRKGDLLVEIDPQDYTLVVEQKKHAVTKAEADLQLEMGSQQIAQKEWQIINQLSSDVDPKSRDLALRKPQLAKAINAVEAAKTDLQKAKLDLSRTKVTAPFDAVITAKNADTGSLVNLQTPLLTLTAADHFWAEISLPTKELAWINLHNQETPVTIWGTATDTVTGHILNILPTIEQNGLMARLLIDIPNPMKPKSGSPFFLGSHIEAEIQGNKLESVYQLPQKALADEQSILTVADETTLHIQHVHVVRNEKDWVYIDEGMTPETAVILSNIAAPVEGMAVQIIKASSDLPATEKHKGHKN